MRKRNQYYSDVEKLKRLVMIFGVATKKQVAAYLEIPEEKAELVMRAYGRVGGGYVSTDFGVIAKAEAFKDFTAKALDVYLDFKKNGIAGEVYPNAKPFVACCFADPSESVLYELLQISFGEEVLASKCVSESGFTYGPGFFEQRKVVIVESAERIPFVSIDDVFSYCIVEADGRVSYYGTKK